MNINFLPKYKHRMIRYDFNNYVQEQDCRENIEKAYEQGKADTKSDIAKECKYLLACGMGKKKTLEHLIKILEKEQK